MASSATATSRRLRHRGGCDIARSGAIRLEHTQVGDRVGRTEQHAPGGAPQGLEPRRTVAPLLVYAGIIGLSSLPASTFDGIEPPWFLSYLVHLAVYGLLGAALRWALDGSRRPWVLSVVIGLVAGIIDELYQGLIPGREPSAIDVTVDVVGVAIGAWLVGRRLLAMRSGQAT
jgi:VanZ family protein